METSILTGLIMGSGATLCCALVIVPLCLKDNSRTEYRKEVEENVTDIEEPKTYSSSSPMPSPAGGDGDDIDNQPDSLVCDRSPAVLTSAAEFTESVQFGRIASSEIKDMFANADTNKSGNLDFHEFSNMSQNKGVSRLNLRILFDSLDLNKDGTLDVDEFAHYFARYRNEAASLDIHQLFADADSDQSGTIDFEEFAQLNANKGVSRPQLRTIFDALDLNHDGATVVAHTVAVASSPNASHARPPSLCTPLQHEIDLM